MDFRPPHKMLLGAALLLASQALKFFSLFRGTEWIKLNEAWLFDALDSTPLQVAMVLAGLGMAGWGLWDYLRRRDAAKTEVPTSVEALGQQPQIHHSSIGGDSRMAGRDYHEVHQTSIHANPLLEARLAEFHQIDELIVKKDEIQLRETLDFPNILKYNIAMTRRSFAPRTVSAAESKEIDDFFKDGKAVLSAKYSIVTRVNGRINVVGMPGKVFIVNISRKYVETRALLMTMYSSSRLPESVSTVLKDFDKTVEDNMTLMIDSLNDSLSANRRNVLDNDDPSSDRHGSASGRYWSKFVHLRPKADAVSSAIRSFLDIK